MLVMITKGNSVENKLKINVFDLKKSTKFEVFG